MMSAFIKVCKMQEKIIKYGVLQLEGKGLKLLYPFREFSHQLSLFPSCQITGRIIYEGKK
jgi:hypothetical protein